MDINVSVEESPLMKNHIIKLLKNYVRFEVGTAVTMKNAVFRDIKTQFLTQRKYITSPLQSPSGLYIVGIEAFTAVTMKNTVFRI
jgi:hypothetical protein